MTKKEVIKYFKSAIPIKAGDARVKLGYPSTPPRVAVRVIAEDVYQEILELLKWFE